ncbi:Lon protease 2 [Actinomadura rubteroloni]|uniref:Lon protease 2 n=1 Tax=Actinomadura rubteroloni TaxID=1926885 RepID=A0A2P4UG07_9ACTN|nr:LON peptidase substrate-binding domain-containing protein [Actinomadura rubteroloni]POM23969.1 Lon protease 2 [Actinomadura rubteroloni]
MTERLPLFPLGTVLFPGMALSLRVFEDRYLALVRDLLDGPGPRRFGVVSIELGHEVGPGAALRLAEVGCVAELRDATLQADGKYDVAAVGGRRFRMKGTDSSRPYLRAEVEYLPEEEGAEVDAAAVAAMAAFRRYRRALAAAGAGIADPTAPGDRVRLSYEIAAAAVLDGHDKRRLLAAEDAAQRLRAARTMIRRETRLLRAFPTLPGTAFLDGSFHPN